MWGSELSRGHFCCEFEFNLSLLLYSLSLSLLFLPYFPRTRELIIAYLLLSLFAQMSPPSSSNPQLIEDKASVDCPSQPSFVLSPNPTSIQASISRMIQWSTCSAGQTLFRSCWR